MKIIHTGDIHLDSSFTSKNPIEAEKRRNALRAAFSSLILYAKTENVDLFLICGDLFDDECVTKDTLTMLCKQMAEASRCTFIITPGNHDPLVENSPYKLFEFPENVFIFKSSELSHVDINGTSIRIYGSAYTSSSKDGLSGIDVPVLDKSKINILMHHGDLDVHSSVYSPITSSWIEKSGFDYVALGHIHKGTAVSYSGSVPYAYCGCLEGRDFGECGYKGALTGELDKGICTLRPVRFCSKRYEVISIDVTGCDDFSECLTAAAEKCSSYSDDTLLRIEFCGIVSENFAIDEDLLRSVVKNVFYLEVKDKTLALLNIKSLKEDKTIAGEFYRGLEDKLFSDNEEQKRTATLALKYGLRAIYGAEIKP